MSSVFGIDLGTTRSVVAYIDENGRPAVVNSDGDDAIPSVVFFESDSNVVVGKAAEASAAVFPDQVVSLIKRQMGDKDYTRNFWGNEYNPSSISAIILAALAKIAEETTHRAVRQVVITVPAYFGLLEKDATKKAGEIAGLEVIGLVPEPVAAALAYGVTGSSDGTTFLVYDLGGGTFDVTLIRMTPDSVEVLAVDGDHHLGGADWDERLFAYITEQTIEQTGDDSIEDDEGSLHELLRMAEEIKQALSRAETKKFSHRLAGSVATITVTRKQFEEMTSVLLEQTIGITNRMVDEANERYPGIRDQISELLLVGGSTWMPAVAERLRQEFPWEPKFADPDLAVAKGAALYAAQQTIRIVEAGNGNRADDSVTATDTGRPRTPKPGPRNHAAIRAVADSTGLDPEQVGRLAGKAVVNVLPRAVGIRLVDTSQPDWLEKLPFYIEHLVPAQTQLPFQTEKFTAGTTVENQQSIEIEVWEQAGAVPDPALSANRRVDNAGLIEGLGPLKLPAGSPIDITFNVDAEGTVNLVAVEPTSGKELKMSLKITVMSEEQVTRDKAAVSRLIQAPRGRHSMPFDIGRYEQFLIAHGRGQTNPEDLLERYAITLPATDAEVAAQVRAVREYWNRVSVGNSRRAAVASWCRTQDEELRKQPGVHLESAKWWQMQSASAAAADAVIEELPGNFRQDFGSLGVVTGTALARAAASVGLTRSDAAVAARRAGLIVIGETVRLPDRPPLAPTVMRRLAEDLDECRAATVPELIHPNSGLFRIVDRYECVSDASKRLDAVAIEARIAEVSKKSRTAASKTELDALRTLREAHSRGVDLRDVTLDHLTTITERAPTPSMRKSALEKRGVDPKDAAIIAALLTERAVARDRGLDWIRNLLESGQLREATSAAATLVDDKGMAEQAQNLIRIARQRLEYLLDQARAAHASSDDVMAESLLREAALVSTEDAAAERASLAPRLPGQAMPPAPAAPSGDSPASFTRPQNSATARTALQAGSGETTAAFEVAIRQGGSAEAFVVEVVSSDAGEASESVVLDVDGLISRREKLQWAVLASAVATRRVLPETERPVRDIGQLLFTALLGTGEVTGRYRAAAAVAAEREQRLRVVLRIDAPTLAALPWEAMYDQAAGAYVCRHDQLVRHAGVASVPAPMLVQPPLRILGVASSPRGLPVLDVGKEQEQLARALARPISQGLIELHWAPAATWADLQSMLFEGPWHAIHYIGHGDFDPVQDEGFLSLVADNGRAHNVTAHRLVDLMRQATPMPRLAVLNSCAGAQVGISDLFSSTAAALVRGGFTAVAAMQYEISDQAAIAFARGFYTAIAHGLGVDHAISSGRVAILGTGDHTLEWLTPVLYLRGRETCLFVIP